MKLYRIAISIFVALGLTACVGDLDVTPIDPSVTLPDEVLDSEGAYAQLLAKCYMN